MGFAPILESSLPLPYSYNFFLAEDAHIKDDVPSVGYTPPEPKERADRHAPATSNSASVTASIVEAAPGTGLSMASFIATTRRLNSTLNRSIILTITLTTMTQRLLSAQTVRLIKIRPGL